MKGWPGITAPPAGDGPGHVLFGSAARNFVPEESVSDVVLSLNVTSVYFRTFEI